MAPALDDSYGGGATDPSGRSGDVGNLGSRGGGLRLSPDVIEPPDPTPSELDMQVWNPDGSRVSGFNFATWLATLAAGVQAELRESVPGEV